MAKARAIHANRNRAIQLTVDEVRKRQATEIQRKEAQQRQPVQVPHNPQVVQIVHRVVQQAPQKPKFAITSFKPVDAGNDFSYSFEVTLNGDVSPDEFLGEYESFLNNLKKIYKSQYPAADMNSLVVNAKPSLRNGKFVGVARMLTIHIEKMEYDPTTRRGKISARFGPGQERFARDWIKQTIMEPLAKTRTSC